MRPVHRSALRSLVSLLLTAQFLLQPLSVVSPPLTTFAAPLEMDARLSQQPALQSSTLPASTLDSSNPDDIPIPGMGDNPPPPADEPSPDPEIFVAAVALNLTTDRYILGDGNEATLTVTVQRNLAESMAGMTLTLVMPPELRTSGDLTWTLPELAEEEIFSRTVQVGVAQISGQAVYEILAQVSSPGSKDAVMSVPLILRVEASGGTNRPSDATAAMTVAEAAQSVALTSPQGDVAVLAPTGVFVGGSEVRYTDHHPGDSHDSSAFPFEK